MDWAGQRSTAGLAVRGIARDMRRPAQARPWCGVWLAALLAWGCTAANLPPLPEPDLSGAADAVQAQVRDSLKRAHQAPTSPRAVGELGEVLFAYGQLEAAAACFRRCRVLEPSSFRWTYLAGVAEASLGNSVAAREAFSNAVLIRPGNPAAAIRLADILEQSGEGPLGASTLAALLETNPASPAALYRLGRLLAAQQSDQAIGHLEAAVAAEPDYREALYALANAYRASGRTDEAENVLRRYAESDPVPRRHYADPLIDSMDSIRSASAQAVFNEGHSYQEGGDLNAALRAYESVLEIDPSFVQAHVNLISVFGELGNHELARRHYERAVVLDPTIAEAHYNHGVSLHFSGELEGAMAAFRKTLDLNDQHSDAHGNLATLLERQGRHSEAEQHYRQALHNDPGHPMANFHTGRRLAERARYREALPYLERAVETDTAGTALHGYVLAIAYRELGQVARARETAKEAIKHALAQNQQQMIAMISAEFPP